MKKTFGVIGGDRRQAELARLLAADGHHVCTYGLDRWISGGEGLLDQAVSSDVVLLPLPLCKVDGVLNCEDAPMPTADLFQLLHPRQQILAGQIKPQQMREAADHALELTDYFLREELTVANAAATAEGAIQVALEQLDRTLLGMDCLVIGFGRIGKLLSIRLHGLGACVTASARKPEDLAWIRAFGWKSVETSALDQQLDGFGMVFNTVPSLILDGHLLEQLPYGCLCVDLASSPGFDPAAVKALGLPYIWARSLPGRLAPRTAAAAIRDAVYNILFLEERGDPA